MACEYCRYDFGHHPQCPEADEREALYYCAECNSGIYQGDIYYRFGRKKYCKECIDAARDVAEVDDFYYDDRDDSLSTTQRLKSWA